MTEQSAAPAGKKHGIDNLKAFLAFGLALGSSIEKSLADDGKITVGDAGNLLAPLMKAPAAFAGASEAFKEVADLDDEERADLNAYVKANFDIADDRLEAVVEEAFQIALSASKIVSLLKKPEAVQA